MENLLGEQPIEQGQQVLAQSGGTRPAPTAEQLAEFASSQEVPRIQPVASAIITNTDLREQLREEVQREMEILCSSRLANRTLEVETFWKAKLEERTKEVENYWKPNLTEVLSSGRDDKTRELHGEIEKLKTRLEKGPGLIKAAEERGRRQGELDGYNKLSLNPELKPSEDRLNFDFLMKEKEKEIAEIKTARDNWFRDTRKYTQDTNATLRARDEEIERLREQLQHPPPQQPLVTDHTDALIAEGQELQARFENQTQELVSLQQKYNQKANDLANLIARSERESQASSDRELQLGAQSAELSSMSGELEKKTKEVSILRRESDQKAVELIDTSEELERMSGEIKLLREGRHQDSEVLEKYKQQVEAQSKEIASLQARHGNSESSNKEKDKRIESLQDLLDNSSRRQSNGSEQEEINILMEQLADTQSLLNEARSEILSLRDHQVRSELEDLSATSETDNAAPTEAEEELVRALLKKEGERNEAENSRREDRVNASLEGLKETEGERRQMLIDELERQDTELYDAQNKIGELEQQLLASSPSQSTQSPPFPLNTLPSSPISASHPSPSTLPSPTTAPIPSLQRSRSPGLRSLLTVILIFLLAFLNSYLQSLANSGSEHELVSSASRDDRMRWEAWELANCEWNEGVPTYEESWRRTQEIGQMGDWGS